MTPDRTASPAALAALQAQREDLATRLDQLRDRLASLVPEHEAAKQAAAKPAPSKPADRASSSSIEDVLESTTQAAIEHHTWQAKAEAIEVTIQWAVGKIAETEAALRGVEDQIELVQHQIAMTAEAKAGVEALNASVADLKAQLSELHKQGCTHIYTLNLPEFAIDDRGSIQARPVAFRLH